MTNIRSPFTRMSAREKRAISAGALVVIPAIAWVFGLQPMFSRIVDDRRTLAAEREALSKQRTVIDAADDIGVASDAVKAAIAAERDRLFEWTRRNGGPVSAANDFQAWVEAAALETDVWIDNTTVIPDSLAEARMLTPVVMRVAARSTPASAARFLGLVERDEKLVRIERLRLLALPDGSMPPGNIAFEADVIAFMVAGEELDELAAR